MMKTILGTLTVGGLMALSGTLVLGWSATAVSAQSPCVAQCMSTNTGAARCRNYCYGNPSPVYGFGVGPVYGYGPGPAYGYGPGPVYGYGPRVSGFAPSASFYTSPSSADYNYGTYNTFENIPGSRCWAGYDPDLENRPCWAQRALSREK
jgi:hypothetical protein